MEIKAKKHVLRPLEQAKELKLVPDKSLSMSKSISIDIEDLGGGGMPQVSRNHFSCSDG